MRREDVLFWVVSISILAIAAASFFTSCVVLDQKPLEVSIKVYPEGMIPEDATCQKIEGKFMVYCNDGNFYLYSEDLDFL